ncbi:MAG: aminomethyltransferase family protein [Gammaproteobacteria bacterium]|nr:aminomethyltransferase family protein [Gammaproteobacteria bacterium]MDH3859327.1 aminomethyltransferase family protein [Gammaproteobacteria bacterium]
MNAPLFISPVRVREPGINALPPNTERYRVRGGGSVALNLQAGDELQLVSPEGLQPGEITVFDAGGRSDSALIGARNNGSAETLKQILDSSEPSAIELKEALNRLGISIEEARSCVVFSNYSPAGDSVRFIAAQPATCLVAAPGSDMRADQQDTVTDLVAFVHRHPIGVTETEIRLPDPLADPLEDVRIEARTAFAYEVKAGDFIQIIDVEGRECSDFQCFDSSMLERGVERSLDATATRHVVGAAYPAPGLYAKFYDQNFEPMIEVVQDTCGRHDSFGTACTAKYYEEMGYPGHVNCSDNFSQALQPYGVEARKGWMAINLFFNTSIDNSNQMYFDEPWSRPGDYVLMRALKDMVCVSSACPCDVDPANGWNPTDIHMRIYAGTNSFNKATAFRMTADADKELTQETGFHSRTSEHTRNFTEYAGYWLANSYTNHGALDEYWACREGAVVIDLSPLRKYEVTGPDAELLLQTCVTRDIRRLAVGQVVYTAMCYENGGMIDDGTVFRLGQNNFRWIGGSDESGIWLREQAEALGLQAWVRNSTDQLHNLQVQGPKSRDVLKQIIWTRPDQATLEELEWFRFSIARIGDEQGIPLVVSRTGYTGELGYEVFCHPNDAPEVWDAIWEAGEAYDLTPLGLEALDMLRIEAGLIFAGYEFSDQTDPFEAGIPFTVPLSTKQDDFVGKAALIKRKENPQRVLVGLELTGDELAANGDGVEIGRNQVGEITSAVRSPILGKNVALCRMQLEHAVPGTEVEVGKLDGKQKRLPAKVVGFPFYDPTKSRVRDVPSPE